MSKSMDEPTKQDPYKGESWPKKLARVATWEAVLMESKIRGVGGIGRTAVLAGRNGGDIPCLLSFGVAPQMIIAIDKVHEALRASQSAYPDVDHRLGRASIVLRLLPRWTVSVVFLDLCSCLTKDVLDEIVAISTCMPHGGLLAVNLLYGRERQFARGVIERAASWWMASTTAAVGSPDRDTAICHWVLERKCGRAVIPLGEIHYQSVTDNGRGVPMMTTLFRVVNLPRYCNPRKALAVAQQLTKPLNGGTLTWNLEIPTDPDRCKRHIASALRAGLSPRRFGLSDGQASALKAHETMGTYGTGQLQWTGRERCGVGIQPFWQSLPDSLPSNFVLRPTLGAKRKT